MAHGITPELIRAGCAAGLRVTSPTSSPPAQPGGEGWADGDSAQPAPPPLTHRPGTRRDFCPFLRPHR